ncbi:MAG: phytanoyl-CoA dioxygenase family protein [Chitinophagales bacterium]
MNSLLYKPKTKNNEVPWHQDFLSRPNESEKILTWMAIDDATKENGCLKIIPGSHKQGFREWYRVKGETHHDRIKISEAELQKAAYVEMNAGDVLIFSNYLIHSSEENNSDLPRRAFRAVFKKLDDAKIPRGAPIMMRSNLDQNNLKEFKQEEQNAVKKLLHKVGNYLTKL